MFKDVLKDLINEHNLNRRKFSEESGIPYGTITGWVSKNKLPDYTALIKVADFFQCSIDYLVGRQDEFGNNTYEHSRPKDEQSLLNNYRALPDDKKEIVIKMVESMKH